MISLDDSLEDRALVELVRRVREFVEKEQAMGQDDQLAHAIRVLIRARAQIASDQRGNVVDMVVRQAGNRIVHNDDGLLDWQWLCLLGVSLDQFKKVKERDQRFLTFTQRNKLAAPLMRSREVIQVFVIRILCDREAVHTERR